MKFEQFLSLVSKIQNLPLPGQSAQFEMAPMQRVKELKAIDIQALRPKTAAVMALFYPDDKMVTHFVLILRRTYKGVHSNQVGFPGGKVENEDRNLKVTALRETEEEVGVPMQAMEILKSYTRIYVPPSNFWVYPYLGVTQKRPSFVAQEDEVEAIIEVPLAEFLQKDALTEQKIKTSYMDAIKVPAFQLQGHVVWGATAMMLSEVRATLLQGL